MVGVLSTLVPGARGGALLLPALGRAPATGAPGGDDGFGRVRGVVRAILVTEASYFGAVV